MGVLHKKRVWFGILGALLLTALGVLLYPFGRYYAYTLTHPGREYPENYTGAWKRYNDISLCAEMNFKDGLLDGEYIEYHLRGFQVVPEPSKIIHYKNGVKHGKYQQYVFYVGAIYVTSLYKKARSEEKYQLSVDADFDHGVCRRYTLYDYPAVTNIDEQGNGTIVEYIRKQEYLFDEMGILLYEDGDPRPRVGTVETEKRIPWFIDVPDWFHIFNIGFDDSGIEVLPDWVKTIYTGNNQKDFIDCYMSEKLGPKGVNTFTFDPCNRRCLGRKPSNFNLIYSAPAFALPKPTRTSKEKRCPEDSD